MKILLATFWGLPHVGGVDLYIRQLKLGLEQHGHQVDILCRYPDGSGYSILNKRRHLPRKSIYSLVESKIKTYFKESLSGLDPIIQDAEMEQYCYELGAAYLGVDSYDLIHAQDVISARALFRIKRPQTALVTTIHGHLAGEWFLSLLRQGDLENPERKERLWQYAVLREQLGLNSADAATLPTQWMKRMLAHEFAIPMDKLTVVPNGIDIRGFTEQLHGGSDMHSSSGKKVIICPARFDVIKGHKYLIRALAKLRRERDDWVCWLVGSGGLEFNLRELVKLHGIEADVAFLGTRRDVPALLKQSDIFVLPSLQDNHPYAVMEAQVAGKAVIVSDAGGMPEMVAHGETGLVFPVGNDEQLYQYLRSLLSDEQLRHHLSSQARHVSNERWSLEVMMSRMDAVYEMALAASRHQEWSS
ncbi:glycosyltransferase family 4 protein [Paenibacillus sp. OV219]|uniref:glycosyltransferase family 4 protein n=1 Tax=Paenibacillus sp. OV219 TaxID=1884377 RepID=UPI0008CFEB24|nr:glycosyltransferase family 4 protein [Paenibacillus sp. OV219]SEN04395.1 Glycosyltransferase involved in cell wall bisynthesis [Paenibacillus sp. OV219]